MKAGHKQQTGSQKVLAQSNRKGLVAWRPNKTKAEKGELSRGTKGTNWLCY